MLSFINVHIKHINTLCQQLRSASQTVNDFDATQENNIPTNILTESPNWPIRARTFILVQAQALWQLFNSGDSFLGHLECLDKSTIPTLNDWGHGYLLRHEFKIEKELGLIRKFTVHHFLNFFFDKFALIKCYHIRDLKNLQTTSHVSRF